MQLFPDTTGSISWLQETVMELEQDEAYTAIVVLTCDENGWVPEDLGLIARNSSKPLFGGIFPGLIYESEKLLKGTIVLGLEFPVEVMFVKNLSSDEVETGSMFESYAHRIENAQSIYVFVDGFSDGISKLIDGLFYEFGVGVNCIGGGAGSLTLEPKPCIISNEGVSRDSAVICLSSKRSELGVSHGWKQVSEAVRVTEANGKHVQSFDWRPAFEVYREVIESHSNLDLSKMDIGDLAKYYPFGLNRLNSELIVRDPLVSHEDKSLSFISDIPEGAFLYVLNGDKKSLIDAAHEAKAIAFKSFPESLEKSTMFVVDCISRVLFLGDDFSQEIGLIKEEGIPLFGVLTFGEITNQRWESLEFHNKSIVVSVSE